MENDFGSLQGIHPATLLRFCRVPVNVAKQTSINASGF